MKERWLLQKKKTDFTQWAQEYAVSPLMIRLMLNRGVAPEKMGQYLNPNLDNMYNPDLIYDGMPAVGLLQQAIHNHNKIAIASDFDCDGIFSSMVLSSALTRLGASVMILTPNRVEEGYGLNRRIVEEAVASDASFLLTCDNGIAAVEEIAYAKQLGMTVVITDHHEVPSELPTADAIVNPKQECCQYPYKELCGAGVAFKLMCLLYRIQGRREEELYDLLPYVAIATVADVMRLTDENRILVAEGLRRLRLTQNPGLCAVIDACGLKKEDLQSYHIGFVIGPCFNASGRLSTVEIALELLQSNEYENAFPIAEKLVALNEERKRLTNEGMKEAVALLEKNNRAKDPVILLVLACHESLAGIIAGRVREQFGRPTFVFTEHDGVLKGSGRSIAAYSMYERLVECKDLLLRFGGHPMAAGLSIASDRFEELRQRLIKMCGLKEMDFCEEIHIDADMPVSYVSEKLIEELQMLEPCGNGNTKPLFAEAHFHIIRARKLGEAGRVLRMSVVNRNGYPMEAIYFGDVDGLLDYLKREFGEPEVTAMLEGKKNAIDIGFTYYPEINEYRGNRNLQIIVRNYCRILCGS